uniref:Uncharacterized protein n=1 Tax=Arundo donax TaxID=35708 RepID=A0A0A8XQ36_ARUDO
MFLFGNDDGWHSLTQQSKQQMQATIAI